MLFNKLTGAYVTVSNYPGTTVEVYRGKSRIGDSEYEVIDTPGMYSMVCITDDERVTRDLLLAEEPKAIIHVVDAKNLQRMLHLTFQLIEGDFPVILALNIMDEAEKIGLRIDIRQLEEKLGIPVVSMTAVKNKGVEELKERVRELVRAV